MSSWISLWIYVLRYHYSWLPRRTEKIGFRANQNEGGSCQRWNGVSAKLES